MSDQPPAREPEPTPPVTENPRASVPSPIHIVPLTAPPILPSPSGDALAQQQPPLLTKAKSAVMRPRNVYVTGLPPNVAQLESFHQFMSQYGPIESLRVARQKDSNGRDTDKFYGFALMGTEDAARRAIRALNNAVLPGDYRLQARISTNDIKGAKASRIMRARTPQAPAFMGYAPPLPMPAGMGPMPVEQLRPSFPTLVPEPTVVGPLDQPRLPYRPLGDMAAAASHHGVFPPVPPLPVGVDPALAAALQAHQPRWPLPFAFGAAHHHHQHQPHHLHHHHVPTAHPPEWQPVPPLPAGVSPPPMPAGVASPYVTVPQGAYLSEGGQAPTYPYLPPPPHLQHVQPPLPHQQQHHHHHHP